MKLAINGGKKVRETLFDEQESHGKEELESIKNIFDNNMLLSAFRGNWIPAFYGGPYVRKAQMDWSDYFHPDYSSIGFNSCTSALIAACGAIDIRPGDEVIVTPWSMTCSATAPMVYGGVPVFADIERDCFCLDPKSIEEKITDRTRAIIVVDLFGQPYDVPRIKMIADKYNLYVIEDAAQAPGSRYLNIYSGFNGDIGCFSFTQGKHLTTGEGGMLVTRDTDLNIRASMIRNHAEAVISAMENADNVPEFNDENLLGMNLRMTEIQGAILIEQLKKLKRFVELRQNNVKRLNQILSQIPAIKPAVIRENCTHSYYVAAYHWDEEIGGIHRDKFINAVKAELTGEIGRPDKGVAINNGYIQPLYKMPLFKYKNHWSLNDNNSSEFYRHINLPNVEHLQNNELFIIMLHGLPLNEIDFKDIENAFLKVWENKNEIK